MRVVLQSVSDELPLDVMFFRNSFGFRESDSFLLDVLKLAIGNLEVRAGISILKKVWKVVHNNNQIFLSNGPVLEVISISNSKGVPLVPLSTARSHDNLLLTFPDGLGFITIFYRAGYDACNLPECLKNNIISEFLKIYDANERQLSLDINDFSCLESSFDRVFG